MINLGTYETDDCRQYSCRFFKKDRKVVAIGPLPTRTDECVDTLRGYADTEEEARKNITETLGPGQFVETLSVDGLMKKNQPYISAV